MRAQRARLRAALADVLAEPVTMTVLRERMYERGYYQHTTGRWKRRQSDRTDAVIPDRRGPSWHGIKVARNRKKRRK